MTTYGNTGTASFATYGPPTYTTTGTSHKHIVFPSPSMVTTGLSAQLSGAWNIIDAGICSICYCITIGSYGEICLELYTKENTKIHYKVALYAAEGDIRGYIDEAIKTLLPILISQSIVK